jgi:hypothetical protein
MANIKNENLSSIFTKNNTFLSEQRTTCRSGEKKDSPGSENSHFSEIVNIRTEWHGT